jgi:hypothetical protein
VLYLCRLLISVAATTSNISTYILTAGSGISGGVYYALINTSGTIVAQTANINGDSALTTSGALWIAPWSSSYSAAAGYYYGAVLFGAGTTTAPAFKAAAPTTGASVNFGASIAAVNLRAAQCTNSLASLPGSVIMSSVTAESSTIWMGLT